jgi:F-type H+-transporting ATPase subunit b
MLIDWFTVGAQALNFLILVWLLKRFLYKPVLDAIDAREKRIQLELGAAAAKQTEAQAQSDEFRNKNKAFDEQRVALLAKVAAQSNADRERLLGEVRKEADDLRTAYANAMRADQARLGRQITQLAKNEVFGIARKALTDLATAKLEGCMAEEFVRRIRTLDAKAKDLLAVALAASSEPAVLRSSFDLPAQPRAAIQTALNETFAADIRMRFDTAPDIICGIELSASGQKLAWSIADYLEVLERKAGALIDTEMKPAPDAPNPVPIALAIAK